MEHLDIQIPETFFKLLLDRNPSTDDLLPAAVEPLQPRLPTDTEHTRPLMVYPFVSKFSPDVRRWEEDHERQKVERYLEDFFA